MNFDLENPAYEIKKILEYQSEIEKNKAYSDDQIYEIEHSIPCLPSLIIDSIDEYSNSPEINRILRGLKKPIDSLPADTREYIEKLDAAFDLVPPLPNDILVFRGIGPVNGQEYFPFDEGYVSTALTPTLPLEFITLSGNTDCCLLVILVPRGSKVLRITGEIARYGEQEEVLLYRNATFNHVQKITFSKNDRTVVGNHMTVHFLTYTEATIPSAPAEDKLEYKIRKTICNRQDDPEFIKSRIVDPFSAEVILKYLIEKIIRDKKNQVAAINLPLIAFIQDRYPQVYQECLKGSGSVKELIEKSKYYEDALDKFITAAHTLYRLHPYLFKNPSAMENEDTFNYIRKMSIEIPSSLKKFYTYSNVLDEDDYTKIKPYLSSQKIRELKVVVSHIKRDYPGLYYVPLGRLNTHPKEYDMLEFYNQLSLLEHISKEREDEIFINLRGAKVDLTLLNSQINYRDDGKALMLISLYLKNIVNSHREPFIQYVSEKFSKEIPLLSSEFRISATKKGITRDAVTWEFRDRNGRPLALLENERVSDRMTDYNILHRMTVNFALSDTRMSIPNINIFYTGFMCSPAENNVDELCSTTDIDKVNFVYIREWQENIPFTDVFNRKDKRQNLSMLLQVVFTLLILQETDNFVHGNLIAENLRVVPLQEETTLIYTMPDETTSFTIKTNHIVKIEDFSQSTILVKDEKSKLKIGSSFLKDETNAVDDKFLRLYDLSVLFHDLKRYDKPFVQSNKKMRQIAHIQKDWLGKGKKKKYAEKIFSGEQKAIVDLAESLYADYNSLSSDSDV